MKKYILLTVMLTVNIMACHLDAYVKLDNKPVEGAKLCTTSSDHTLDGVNFTNGDGFAKVRGREAGWKVSVTTKVCNLEAITESCKNGYTILTSDTYNYKYPVAMVHNYTFSFKCKDATAPATQPEEAYTDDINSTCFEVGTYRDLNGDGEHSKNEITSSHVVCDGEDGHSALITKTEATAAVCVNGGSIFKYGLDLNDDNVLDADEVTGSSIVCNGVNGHNGSNGSDGSDGADGHNSLVVKRDATVSECANGGAILTIGLDLDNSDSLEPSEITNTAVVCNGDKGQNGSNGHTAIMDKMDADLNACANGGTVYRHGIDDNDNGTLDDAEVLGTSIVCNGINGHNGSDGADGHNSLMTKTPAVASDCSNGGYTFKVGVDRNNNGGLDSNEVTSANTVCNGSNGSNGLTSLIEETHFDSNPTCPKGGVVIATGVDKDSNGKLETVEVTKRMFICDTHDGESAYQIAVRNGFSGTEKEWLISLQGANGHDGNTSFVVSKCDCGVTSDSGSINPLWFVFSILLIFALVWSDNKNGNMPKERN